MKMFALMVLLAAASARAADAPPEHTLTLYGGARGGGSFTDASNGSSLSMDSSAAGSISLDFGLDSSRQVQLFVSHQSTHLSLPSGASGALSSQPMRVSYAHLGGTNFFDGKVGQGPYVVGGIGVTLFDLSAPGYGSELRPSINLGLGYQLPLGANISLRLEGRVYSTLVNSSGGLFCSGGCVVSIQGDAITQGEAMLGLSASF